MFRSRTDRDRGREPLAAHVLAAGVERLAVVGLHPGAGVARAVERLSEALVAKGKRVAIVSFAPPPETVDPDLWAGESLRPPAGSLVWIDAASTRAPRGALRALETESRGSGDEGAPGEGDAATRPAWAEIVEPCEVILHAPYRRQGLEAALEALVRHEITCVIVAGRWSAPAFVSPELTDGVVLSVGAGMSESPESTARAVAHHAEILTLTETDGIARTLWSLARSQGRTLFGDAAGRVVESIESRSENWSSVVDRAGGTIAVIAHPGRLDDARLGRLVRGSTRCRVVVCDPSHVRVSPVYYRAWGKDRGSIEVARSCRLIGVTTNPTRPSGPDADPGEFLAAIAETVDPLPTHDLELDAARARRRSWLRWRRSV